MNRIAVAILVLACGSLAVGLAVQRGTISELRGDAEQLRARLDKVESRQKEAATKAAVEEVQEQAARAERKAIAAAQAAASVPAAPKAAAGEDPKLPLAVSEEELQKIIDARVEEKLEKRGDKKGGLGEDRKMALHDLGKELGLDPAAQARVAGIANTAKKEILEILKTPRPDGTSMADELIAAFTGGDPAAIQKLFGKIMTEKIPGTDTPYVTAVARVQEKANQNLSVAMGTEAFGRFQHMSVKPENIETGFDPWAEWLQTKTK